MKQVKNKQRRNFVKIITLSSIIVILAVFMCLSSIFATYTQKVLYHNNILLDNASLRVHFINVGQGDAIAISLPDGKTMLIDAGPVDSVKELESYLIENVVTNHTDRSLDYVVMTHSDADHVGGMARVLDKFGAKNIYRPNIYCSADSVVNGLYVDSDTYSAVIDKVNHLAKHGTNVHMNKKGINISGDGYTIEFLSPDKDDYASTNEYSPFILLSAFDKTFLFTGDATFDNEQSLLVQFPDLDIDVLKVAHHGASTSTSADFVRAITPEYAVISVGHNINGHPTSGTLTNLRLEVEEKNILYTQTSGHIAFVIGAGYNFGVLEGNIKTTFNIDWYVYFVTFLALEMVVIICLVVQIRNVRQNTTKINNDNT